VVGHGSPSYTLVVTCATLAHRQDFPRLRPKPELSLETSVALSIGGGLIHLLLVLAVIVVAFNLISSRGRTAL